MITSDSFIPLVDYETIYFNPYRMLYKYRIRHLSGEYLTYITTPDNMHHFVEISTGDKLVINNIKNKYPSSSFVFKKQGINFSLALKMLLFYTNPSTLTVGVTIFNSVSGTLVFTNNNITPNNIELERSEPTEGWVNSPSETNVYTPINPLSLDDNFVLLSSPKKRLSLIAQTGVQKSVL